MTRRHLDPVTRELVQLFVGHVPVRGLMVVLTVMFLGGAAWLYHHDAQIMALVKEGRPVPGSVTAIEDPPGKAGPFLHYGYQVDGRRYEHRIEVSATRYRNLAPGQPVAVRYLPSAPSVAVLPTVQGLSASNQLPLRLLMAGLVLFGLCCALGAMFPGLLRLS